MLTCDICGEEVLLVEDMKTHLLLSHLENDVKCPLCSLCGVTYDELCFHISSAHPETQNQEPQTSQSCSAGASCAPAAATGSVQPKENNARESVCSSQRGTTPVTSQSPETGSESVRHHDEEDDRFKTEHKKAKQKRLSSPRKGDLTSRIFLFHMLKSPLTLS